MGAMCTAIQGVTQDENTVKSEAFTGTPVTKLALLVASQFDVKVSARAV
jgi:hypothetical protein